MNKTNTLFPYFGGKAKIAPVVWERLGAVKNYVDPFCGSGAVFFQKPHACTSTINDFSGHVANLWRAIHRDHEAVALEASKLLGEADMHACELEALSKSDELTKKLEVDIEYYDAKLAGRYMYGLCNKIGAFAVSGGPWINLNGSLTDRRLLNSNEPGITRVIPHLGAFFQKVGGIP